MELGSLAERVRPVALAGEQGLPVAPALAGLLPGGLRRGSTVGVSGRAPGATSLALALLAEPSATGSWVAVVGLPAVGLLAAAELGVDLERLAVVPEPGTERWAAVVAALVDAFDVVLVGGPKQARGTDARRLAARARERGAVLIALGPTAADIDVRLEVVGGEWDGVGDGHGHLRARRVTVTADGRRAAARTRRADLWLPSPSGGLAGVDPVRLQAVG